LVELEPKEPGEQRWYALRPPICPSRSVRPAG
jgi:hypothetical protein